MADGPSRESVSIPGADVWPLVQTKRASVQLLELAPRNEWGVGDGWRQATTLDLTVIADGELLVELDGGEVRLGLGDSLVQRATRHRMRADGGQVRALVAHVAEQHPQIEVGKGTNGNSGVRRVVTGVDDAGRSVVIHDGEPPNVFRPGARSVLTDVWQMPGDITEGPWQVEPRGGDVKLGIVELRPGDYSDDAHWHSTATVDVDVVLSGTVQL